MNAWSRDLCLLVNILARMCAEADAEARASNRRSLAHARSHLDRDPATGRLKKAA
jgi:hypothetical protein